MPFSANYRRVRAPQHPLLKVAYRLALTVLLVCVLFVVFNNLTARGLGGWMRIADAEDEDISGVQFKFTNYRAGLNKTGTPFWRSITPGFFCPRDLLTKVGIGGAQNQDSGKWICGLKNLGKMGNGQNRDATSCVVYSFVLEEEQPYFESDILQKTNCSVYLYDPMREVFSEALQILSENSRLHFEKLTIGGEERFNKRTLELLMELNGHKWIDILKIDVKAGEYMALERILNDFRTTMPFGQLVINFHVPDWNRPRRSTWMATLFEVLEKRGLRLFFISANYDTPCCAIMSFINIKKSSINKFLSQEDIQAAMDFNT